MHTYIQSRQFPLMVWPYKQQYTEKNPNTEKIYVYASKLRKFSYFNILKHSKTFFNILLVYFRYFVGTNDMLVGYMYRKISKCTDKTPQKHYRHVRGDYRQITFENHCLQIRLTFSVTMTNAHNLTIEYCALFQSDNVCLNYAH